MYYCLQSHFKNYLYFYLIFKIKTLKRIIKEDPTTGTFGHHLIYFKCMLKIATCYYYTKNNLFVWSFSKSKDTGGENRTLLRSLQNYVYFSFYVFNISSQKYLSEAFIHHVLVFITCNTLANANILNLLNETFVLGSTTKCHF